MDNKVETAEKLSGIISELNRDTQAMTKLNKLIVDSQKVEYIVECFDKAEKILHIAEFKQKINEDDKNKAFIIDSLESYLENKDKQIIEDLLIQWEWEQDNNLEEHSEKIKIAKKLLLI